MIAPSPDFRYVGLSHETVRGISTWAGVASSTVLGVGAASGLLRDNPGTLALAAAAAGLSVFAAHALTRSETTRRISLAIVPWGVLIEEESAPRVLFWSAVKRIRVETRHAREAGSATTLFSDVTVETDAATWSGRTAGAPPLERLLAYHTDYADEQSRPIAFDLDGAVHGEGPFEPDCEPLFGSVRAYLSSGAGASRLELPPLGYRSASAWVASEKTVEELRAILQSREPCEADPRAFAAVIAAELSVRELAPDLTALVQCPHPLVAAVAKQAARKLGVSSQRVGTLDEVRPFLSCDDAEELLAWAP